MSFAILPSSFGPFHRRSLAGPATAGKSPLYISVIGGDTQISAVSAAISMGKCFVVGGPDLPPRRICLDRNPQCYKGSLQLAGRKKPLRHLIGISEEFACGASSVKDRTLLADSGALFVWPSLSESHGIPGIPQWAEWFLGQLEKHKALARLW